VRAKLFKTCLAAVALLQSCSSTRPYADQIPELQSWYRRALAQPNAAPAFCQFHDAWHGDRAALRAYFSDAWRLMHAGYINAEDGQALSATLLVLVRQMGDDAYSAALALESPEVRSAVAASTNIHSFTPYPKSHRLLATAPKIDFPLLKLYRNG
jgi:hypothetical protein